LQPAGLVNTGRTATSADNITVQVSVQLSPALKPLFSNSLDMFRICSSCAGVGSGAPPADGTLVHETEISIER
jgi:hypothetical protein